MTLSAGTRLGSYQILRSIGAGGMGEVYRARDTKLSRDVAIKVLPAALAADAERVGRFEKEARTASALNHPNIVTIYEIGEADGISFIAMELIEGKTLRELLGAGALPLKKLLALAAQTADGLARAHAAGIVHRDLKPENLMITKEGFVKILDFGLAKLIPRGFEGSAGTEIATMTRGTEAGTVLGTVGYMSPEQASGEPADFRSDQFSLGAILYEMAAGRRAFERPTAAQTLSVIIEAEPEPLATVAPSSPTNLVWVIERCLSKDPEERYGSTKDLARDLAAIRDHSSISVSAVEARGPRRLRISRIALIAAALAAAAVAVLTFFAGQRVQARSDRSAPAPQRKVMTFRRGFLTGARFAPDGQTVVYSAAWDGKPSEIFTARVGSSESRPLGIFPAGVLAISPSGEMAVSLGCENRGDPCFGTLARVALAGGAPREVLENVSSADWSPDGKELAVVHVVDGRDRIEYPIGKVLYQTEGVLNFLRVSPRGDLVAFIEHSSLDSLRGSVCVVDRAAKRRRLTEEMAGLTATLWSPAGDEVFFNDKTANNRVHGVSLSGRVRTASWIQGLDDVSRDGLCLDTGFPQNLRRDILALLPGDSKERNMSWLGDSTAADLSPDGRQLLFYEYGWLSSPGPESFVTYLRKTDGSDPKLLGAGKALALSPDGRWALVARPSPGPHLQLLPTGVGEPRTLPGGGILRYHWASFFPDGRRILIAGEEKGKPPRSYIQDVVGGPPRPFLDDGMRATLISPDGREIAGTTVEGLQLIYPADGPGRPRPIESALPGDFLVQWSADGKSIFARGAEERPLTLYRLELATGRRERWKELAPPDLAGFLEFHAGPRGARVTPDGRFYAYTYFTDLERLTLTDLGKNWWK